MADTASRASRPLGGAFGAPGPRARHVVGGSYASKLTLAGDRQATIERSGLDKGSFHIRLGSWSQTGDTLEKPPAERDAFLTEACAGDDALRQEVESLLAYEFGFVAVPRTSGSRRSGAPVDPRC